LIAIITGLAFIKTPIATAFKTTEIIAAVATLDCPIVATLLTPVQDAIATHGTLTGVRTTVLRIEITIITNLPCIHSPVATSLESTQAITPVTGSVIAIIAALNP
jgi:hypothetical protein